MPPTGRSGSSPLSKLGQDDSLLLLILSLAVGVAGLAGLISMKEQNLAQSFVCIDSGGQRCGVGDLQRHKPFPLRLKRRYIHDDAATRVRRLANADRKNVSGNTKILLRTRQSK